jgi:hypothetical protein
VKRRADPEERERRAPPQRPARPEPQRAPVFHVFEEWYAEAVGTGSGSSANGERS